MVLGGFKGQLTLDSMDLDRRDEFSGDAYNPFGAQKMQGIDTEL